MAPKSIQNAIFASMADPLAFRPMFDQQPNVFFFVKDRESRLIAASEPMYSRLSPQRVLLIRGQAGRMGLTQPTMSMSGSVQLPAFDVAKH